MYITVTAHIQPEFNTSEKTTNNKQSAGEDGSHSHTGESGDSTVAAVPALSPWSDDYHGEGHSRILWQIIT